MMENEKSSGQQPDKPSIEIEAGFGWVAARFDKVEADTRAGFARVDESISGLRTEMTELGGTLCAEMTELGGTLRAEMTELGGALRSEMNELGAGLRAEMNELGSTLRAEMNELGAGLRSEINQLGDSLRTEMNTRFLALEGDFKSLQRTLIGSAIGVVGAIIATPIVDKLF